LVTYKVVITAIFPLTSWYQQFFASSDRSN